MMAEPIVLTGPTPYDVNGVFYPYALFMESVIGGLIDFETDIFYMMLTDATYIPNQNVHKFKSVISGELGQSYSGYSVGGMQMPISTVSYTSTTKTLTINASNVQWPLVTFPAPGARYGIVYDSATKDGSGSDVAKPLVGYVDFVSDQTVTDMAFHVNWPSTGMMTLKLP
jgi:hypothetical protein